jgi:hypothetical protein
MKAIPPTCHRTEFRRRFEAVSKGIRQLLPSVIFPRVLDWQNLPKTVLKLLPSIMRLHSCLKGMPAEKLETPMVHLSGRDKLRRGDHLTVL